jgi:hypothetical protein
MKFKHPAFIGEREWRIAVQESDPVAPKFRVGNSDIKPYIVVPCPGNGLNRFPLKRIVFGPRDAMMSLDRGSSNDGCPLWLYRRKGRAVRYPISHPVPRLIARNPLNI